MNLTCERLAPGEFEFDVRQTLSLGSSGGKLVCRTLEFKPVPLLARGLVRRSFDEFNQSADRDSGWTLGSVGCRRVTPRSAGNVQMSPRSAVRKLLEESGGGNRAGFLAADVLDVCDVRFDLI